MGTLHPHKPVIAVIGGGISGLSVAFWLLQHDVEVIVLEQTDRPGGLIKSHRSDGYLADYAANCLLNYLPEVNNLCDAVGVGKEKVYRSDAARNRYLTYKADAVCITAPAYDAARLLRRIAPDTSGMLGRVGYSPMAVVYTGFARDNVRHPLDGVGCMVPSKEGGFILGTLWNSSLFSDRAPDSMVAITNYLGGKRHPELSEKTDEELLDIAINDLKKIIGISGPPDYVRVIRHQRALPQFRIGHHNVLKMAEGLHNNIPGLFIAGNYLGGISVRDCISYGNRLAKQIAKGFSDEPS